MTVQIVVAFDEAVLPLPPFVYVLSSQDTIWGKDCLLICSVPQAFGSTAMLARGLI